VLDGEKRVPVGARAFQILVALIERAGEVVTKDELTSRAWPGTFVEESNLRVHIAGLRRALRDGQEGRRYIVNVPGQGYSFVAPVSTEPVAELRNTHIDTPARSTVLPPSLTEVIGRTEVIEILCAALPQRRFVTLVGPSGIGKTTVALAVARKLARSYRDGVAFVDFAAAAGTHVVANSLSTVLGVPVASPDSLLAVTAFLRTKQMLLLFDSCEHLIEGVAGAAEEIANNAPEVHILATSLEPLRAAGETVHRLLPLGTPPASAVLSASTAMTFPSIRLLVERASATQIGFELSDADAPFAGEICRRLDGIALAVELAASRVAVFGMRELAARLDDRFSLLTSGRRTALPRHQTLRATLDWSYDLLSDRGRKLLRMLAVFNGEFSLDAAAEIMREVDDVEVLSELAELVAKSLVTANLQSEWSRYRLMDSTRIYGLEKLRQGGELESARRSHAAYLNRLFAAAESDCDGMQHEFWLAKYATQLDNVRSALDWADAAPDAARLFVELATRVVLLWVQLSLMSECQSRVERALTLLDRIDDERERKTYEMQLSAALGWALMYGVGRTDAIKAAWSRTLVLADELGDSYFRSRGLWGMWIGTLNKGEWATALDLARRLTEAVSTSDDIQDTMMADRILATTLHYRGEQGNAQRHMERMLGQYAHLDRHPRVARFQVDQKVPAHYFLARILWLRGHYEDARGIVELNIREDRALGNALTSCSVLGQAACPIALYRGDLPDARRFSRMLQEHAERYRFQLWYDWACCFEGVVVAREGDVGAGLKAMRQAFERVGDSRHLPRYMFLLGEYAASLGLSGEIGAGLKTIDELLARSERSEERWYLPEAMRVRSELIMLGGGKDATEVAGSGLRHAIELARKQDARAWELRALVSLTRLQGDRGHSRDVRSQLSVLVDSFPEESEVADLKAARAILADRTALAGRPPRRR
jgi:predicted ATPase/DNA-binding winged helix-turn-helix (wHTH) protein